MPFFHRVMIAILTKDVMAFMKAVSVKEFAQGIDSRKAKLIYHLLTKTHTFQPAGEPHDKVMLYVLRDLLLDSPPHISLEHHRYPARMLYHHVKAYRGRFIHIAAALGLSDIVAKMIAASDAFHWSRYEVLSAKDSEGNTALVLAVQSGSCRTTRVVMKKLTELIRPEFGFHIPLIALIVQDAVHKTTYRICKNPGMGQSVLLLLRLAWSYNTGREVSLMWPIFMHDLDTLVSYMQLRQRFDLFRMPHELHYAVMLYSRTTMTCEEENILYYLLDCKDLRVGQRQVSVNDICSLEVGGRVAVNGTAFHFALSNLSREVCLFHPGYGWGPYKHGAVDPEKLNAVSIPQSREPLEDSPLIEMLHFLASSRTSSTKPNRFGRTPLSCIPPSADPSVMDLMLEIIREQEEADMEEEEEGEGGEKLKVLLV